MKEQGRSGPRRASWPDKLQVLKCNETEVRDTFVLAGEHAWPDAPENSPQVVMIQWAQNLENGIRWKHIKLIRYLRKPNLKQRITHVSTNLNGLRLNVLDSEVGSL